MGDKLGNGKMRGHQDRSELRREGQKPNHQEDAGNDRGRKRRDELETPRWAEVRPVIGMHAGQLRQLRQVQKRPGSGDGSTTGGRTDAETGKAAGAESSAAAETAAAARQQRQLWRQPTPGAVAAAPWRLTQGQKPEQRGPDGRDEREAVRRLRQVREQVRRCRPEAETNARCPAAEGCEVPGGRGDCEGPATGADAGSPAAWSAVIPDSPDASFMMLAR